MTNAVLIGLCIVWLFFFSVACGYAWVQTRNAIRLLRKTLNTIAELQKILRETPMKHEEQK
jgi:hypothetical protein